MSSSSPVKGFEVPLHLSLTQPILLAGVPRSFAIINFTLTAALTLGLGVWWLGLPIGLVVHCVAHTITLHDPLWFDVLKRHLRHKPYLES